MKELELQHNLNKYSPKEVEGSERKVFKNLKYSLAKTRILCRRNSYLRRSKSIACCESSPT